jgi:sorbitol-specific phosphotransferase system component IIA
MTYPATLIRRSALALLVAIGSAGCLRSTTVIDVKGDGSGTIVQETAVSAQALGLLQGMGGANQAGDKPASLFTEEQARKAAAAMGVTFVSGEPIKTVELEGYRARYAFDDIGKVTVKMDQATDDLAPGSSTKKPPFGFTFTRGATSSVLNIRMPDQAPGAGPGGLPLPGAGGTDADKAQAAQAMAMMKMMMKGLFVDVALTVNGRILKSNAPYVDGSRVTLMQIDFDKLLADEAALLKLQSAKDIKSLAAVPGLKVVTEPNVTIEFSR